MFLRNFGPRRPPPPSSSCGCQWCTQKKIIELLRITPHQIVLNAIHEKLDTAADAPTLLLQIDRLLIGHWLSCGEAKRDYTNWCTFRIWEVYPISNAKIVEFPAFLACLSNYCAHSCVIFLSGVPLLPPPSEADYRTCRWRRLDQCQLLPFRYWSKSGLSYCRHAGKQKKKQWEGSHMFALFVTAEQLSDNCHKLLSDNCHKFSSSGTLTPFPISS